MASLLESAVKKQVAQAFKGKLLTCTLRRVTAGGVDDFGDPVPGSDLTWPFDGIVDKFDAMFAKISEINVTDVRVLIIAGSLDTVPQKDDQVKVNVRGDWYQLRDLVERDPAQATYVYSAYSIPDPTA